MMDGAASPFLLVGEVAALEPAALRALQDARGLPVREVPCLYKAAASLRGAEVRMVLIDAAKLSLSAARGLEVFRRHARVPVVLLLCTKPLPVEIEGILRATTIPWEAALPLFPQILQMSMGWRTVGEAAAQAAGGEGMGNPVTWGAAGGYDGFDGQPLLSEDELQTLLGPVEDSVESV